MNTAEIWVDVADATGAKVVTARIVVTHVDTGVKFTASPNSEGYYVLPQLPVGRVHAERGGRPLQARGSQQHFAARERQGRQR
jgi:hypothetical protein